MKKLYTYKEFIKENNSRGFEFNNMIDYTLLNNDASDEDIIRLCEKAKRYGVKSVCVMPKHVRISNVSLRDSDVLVVTVISFPEGTNSTQQKINETKKAIRDGADEIDMVLDWRILKGSISDNHLNYSYSYLSNEIEYVKKAAESRIVKVIVESGNLTEEETHLATEVCISGGADFIKTSTGTTIGSEISKVQIMRNTIDELNSDMQIKASGGIRTLEDILKYRKLRVTRFGMGYGAVDILNGSY